MTPRWPPRLVVVTPGGLDPGDLADLLPRLVGLVDAVHLRRPGWPARACLAEAAGLRALGTGIPLLVNDRVDVALAAGCGVHLRDDGLPPARLRGPMRPDGVGVSRHGAAGLAASRGADYATLSPVLPTPSKPGRPALGMEAFAALAAASPVPVLALGGIEPHAVGRVCRAGAHGVAVLSGLWSGGDPVQRARDYARALEETERG